MLISLKVGNACYKNNKLMFYFKKIQQEVTKILWILLKKFCKFQLCFVSRSSIFVSDHNLHKKYKIFGYKNVHKSRKKHPRGQNTHPWRYCCCCCFCCCCCCCCSIFFYNWHLATPNVCCCCWCGIEIPS